MKKPYLVFLLGWSMAGSAGTIVYTDRQHPPDNLSPDTQIVWLDAAEQRQQQIFAQLSAEPQQAAQQAQAILQSPQWQQQEQQLVKAYRDIIQAWQLGVNKYPAVVFDNQYVVYGTADIAQAIVFREQHQP
ncbi:TIGR03757 family integrating conjugative element protein [Xenorhabdus sp. SGI246]|uniref:TIGR03757 family integrating conjugative element protein n=1 Tax=Xenorhabdus sp. SGI246 TaxID=3158263 RepID=UPI00349F58E7